MAARGRPFEPGNKFGRGRPPGSRNKAVKARELLDSYAEQLMKACLNNAVVKNDIKFMRLCMERAIPIRRDLPVKIGAMPLVTLADVNKASEKIWKMVTTGRVTPAQGESLMDMIERRRKVIETEELEKGIKLLESQA